MAEYKLPATPIETLEWCIRKAEDAYKTLERAGCSGQARAVRDLMLSFKSKKHEIEGAQRG